MALDVLGHMRPVLNVRHKRGVGLLNRRNAVGSPDE